MNNLKDSSFLKFGLIGCSNAAEKYFLPSLDDFKYGKLEFIASRSNNKSETWSKKYHCVNHGNYDEIIESDVDVIYISLPISMHEEWTVKAAKAGKHVICEKSSTISYESAKNMVETCKNNNVRLIEALSFRFHPQHTFVKQLISDELDEFSNFYGMYGFPSPPIADIRWNPKLGGGLLNDVSCYPICASRMFFDSEPLSVFSNFEIHKKYDVDVANNIIINFSNNRFASIVCKYGNYYQSMYSIWGKNGLISTKRAYSVKENFESYIYLHKDDKIYEKRIPSSNQFRLMMENFSKTILNLDNPTYDYENDLLNQAKLLDCIRQSNSKESLIFLDEFD